VLADTEPAREHQVAAQVRKQFLAVQLRLLTRSPLVVVVLVKALH
jgi:hypothetical protein